MSKRSEDAESVQAVYLDKPSRVKLASSEGDSWQLWNITGVESQSVNPLYAPICTCDHLHHHEFFHQSEIFTSHSCSLFTHVSFEVSSVMDCPGEQLLLP